ncbi:MAG: hypothetical protein FWF29_10970, partial [Treponema sp.]|nr:hypothetical protein [Treponema sp.]
MGKRMGKKGKSGIYIIIGVLIIGSLLMINGCDLSSDGKTTVIIRAIQGVTPPVTGGIPTVLISPTKEYTGTVAWAPALPEDGRFETQKTYTATITLSLKPGFTFTGTKADFFSVQGADIATSPANSGVVTAEFPETTPASANTLKVYGGSGTGSFLPGTIVTLTANQPATGYQLKNWTFSPNITNFINDTDIHSGTIQFVMPPYALIATANFEMIVYSITVIQPTQPDNADFTVTIGSNNVTSARMGDQVLISAPEKPGNVFTGFIITIAGTPETFYNNPYTLLMPPDNVTITSGYAALPEDSGSIVLLVRTEADFSGLQD